MELTETVLINGRESPLTLTDDGRFLWPDGGWRWLSVNKEVLGFSVAAEGCGRVIKVSALIEEGGDGVACYVGAGTSGKGKLVRKELVFEASSDKSARAWCSKLEGCI